MARLTAQDRLLDEMVRRQVNLLRFDKGLRERVLKAIDSSERSVVALIRDRLEEIGAGGRAATDKQFAELDAMLKEVRDLRSVALGEATKTAREELGQLGQDESEFVTSAFNKAVQVQQVALSAPAQARLRAATFGTPYGGRLFNEWFKGLKDGDAQRITDVIRGGFLEGATVPEMVRRVRGTPALNGTDGVTEMTRNQAETLVRTSVNHFSNTAREEVFASNEDLFVALRWTSVLDGRTSMQCAERDGRITPLPGKELPESLQDEPLLDPPDARPPAHPNAFVRGTRIATARGWLPIERVRVGDLVWTHRERLRRVYAVIAKVPDRREVLRIHLDSGRVLFATDEHPVLLHGRGWVRAGKLGIGDQLFQYDPQRAWRKRSPMISPDPRDYPSFFDETVVPGEIDIEPRGVPSSIDLEDHTRATMGEVSYEAGDDGLVLEARAAEWFHEIRLQRGWIFSEPDGECIPDLLHIARIPAGILSLHAAACPATPPICLLGLPPSRVQLADEPFAVGAGRDACLLLRHHFESKPFRPHGQAAVCEVAFSFDEPKRLPLLPVVDPDQPDSRRLVHSWTPSCVVSVEKVPYDDTVFNLSVEDDESYVAEGLISKNCRSIMVAVIDPAGVVGSRPFVTDTRRREEREVDFRAIAKEEGRPIKEVRADWAAERVGQVPAKTTYAEWFGRQSAGFQDDVLGPTRGKLYRDGGLTLDKFVDRSGYRYTLDQLRSLAPGAFEEAGV